MSTPVRRFHSRSPRYVLNTDDQSLLRFAPMATKGVTMLAKVRDLSETGLSFSVHGEVSHQPDEGDALKIEFTIPGRKQIACFATVVRVDIINEWDPEWGDRSHTLIALKFRNLPSAHQRALQLSMQTHAPSKTNRDTDEIEVAQNNEYLIHSFALGAMTFALAISFYAIVLPPSVWIGLTRKFFGT